MDSYGDRDKKHKDKVKDYECRKIPFERFFVSSVEFCDAKHKKNSMTEKIIEIIKDSHIL